MRRRQTPPVQAHQPPFSVGMDIGNTRPHASVVEAEGRPCVPKVVAVAHTRAGGARVYALRAEATGQAAPAEVSSAGEATGPSWRSLSEALTAQGDQVLVLNPWSVKAR